MIHRADEPGRDGRVRDGRTREVGETALAGSNEAETSERLEAGLHGERLEAARAEDRRWREAQRERVQAGIDAACRQELRARQVALAGAYLLANFLLMAVITLATDWASGNRSSSFGLGYLIPVMVWLPLLISVPWLLLWARRTHLQRQAHRMGVEVTLPEALRTGPRGRRAAGRAARPQAHAVERLLAQRRARAIDPGTVPGGTRP